MDDTVVMLYSSSDVRKGNGIGKLLPLGGALEFIP